jgi:hypothetical protein
MFLMVENIYPKSEMIFIWLVDLFPEKIPVNFRKKNGQSDDGCQDGGVL